MKLKNMANSRGGFPYAKNQEQINNPLKKFQTPNMALGQKVTRTNLSSLHNLLRVAQILSVTASHSQMKKDSVQAVFIQLYTDYISLRVSVINYPNTIGSVQRLPDDIGLVQYSNHVNDIHSVQPLGSIPRDCSSLRIIRLIQAAKDSSPSCCWACSIISRSSGSRRNWNGGLPRLSFLCVDTSITPIVMCLCVITHYIQLSKKAMPHGALTLTGHLTTNDRTSIEVAMKDHITPVTGRNSLTPNIVFTWRFAECQENKATYHHVTAHTEDEARSLLPGLPLVFTARIRQGVNHV